MPLAPGQTSVIQNPEFDRRVLANGAVDNDGRFIAPAKNTLYRGRIETADRARDGNIYRLQFLYNPTDYTHSGSVDANSSVQASQNNPDYLGSAAVFMDINQTVDFSLLFDRTYEAWAPPKHISTQQRWSATPTDLAKWGVLCDVQAMYMLFGMYDQITRVSPDAPPVPPANSSSANAAEHTGSDGSTPAAGSDYALNGVIDSNAYQQMTPTSIMSYRPVWAIFGPNVRYFGVIKSFGIQYTHFTQNMVPVRAAISFSMMLIPKPDMTVDDKRAKKRQKSATSHQAKRTAGRPGFDAYGNIL